MTDFASSFLSALQATSALEWVSVGFGLLYVILAARENSWCWPAAFIGTGTAIFLFWDASLLMESALNVFYLVMAVYGWWYWRSGHTEQNASLPVRSWGMKQHFIVVLIIAALTVLSGFVLQKNTQAALPFLDSFTTWSAVICTFMIAWKVLENWLYWIVIDLASIYLYLDRGLALYAVLFLLYTVIAIFGYVRWRKSWQEQKELRY